LPEPARRAAAAGALTLAAAPARAHSPVDGFDGFLIGFLHPLGTPSQILALLALGLLAARGWPERFDLRLAIFAGGLAAGFAAGQLGADAAATEPVLLGLALALATLGALLPQLPGRATAGAAALAGLGVGIVSTPDPGPPGAVTITLIGSFLGATLALLYLAAAAGWLARRFPAPWMAIGQRVLAAWIAAISMVMLALVFAPAG
jgi:hydrogenase/urease accessory protein HupE